MTKDFTWDDLELPDGWDTDGYDRGSGETCNYYQGPRESIEKAIVSFYNWLSNEKSKKHIEQFNIFARYDADEYEDEYNESWDEKTAPQF
jgi:hypothetical protein